MARPPDEERKRELLEALLEAFALHHFGSRDELLLSVVEEVERRQAATLGALPAEPADAAAAMWSDLRRPELRPFERLFFECYARGAQGEEPFTRLLPAAVDGWIEAARQHAAGRADEATIRLGLAVTRGLLLDLVATDDDEGVDAAAARFVELLRRSG
jgi:AcrR family transcriptional regulator